MGRLLRAITEDGAILATVLDATDMAARAEQVHHSSATVTAAMGRLLTAAAMMGAALKNDDDTITLRMAGGGPAGAVLAVSDAFGNARVTVQHPTADLPLNAKGKLDVGGVIGTDGFLSVIREMGDLPPQTGYSPLVTGEIGDDLTYFFANSEQVPTVCSLGVLVNPDLTVAAAGGFLLQLLPGADDGTIDQLEAVLPSFAPVSSMIHEGKTPSDILEIILAAFPHQVIEDRQVEYRCNCSRERVERALLSLGKEELARLASEQETTEVACHFCERKYHFSASQLQNMHPAE